MRAGDGSRAPAPTSAGDADDDIAFELPPQRAAGLAQHHHRAGQQLAGRRAEHDRHARQAGPAAAFREDQRRGDREPQGVGAAADAGRDQRAPDSRAAVGRVDAARQPAEEAARWTGRRGARRVQPAPHRRHRAGRGQEARRIGGQQVDHRQHRHDRRCQERSAGLRHADGAVEQAVRSAQVVRRSQDRQTRQEHRPVRRAQGGQHHADRDQDRKRQARGGRGGSHDNQGARGGRNEIDADEDATPRQSLDHRSAQDADRQDGRRLRRHQQRGLGARQFRR